MNTIGELVSGCADGVQLEPCDPSEPDDWPDYIEIGRNDSNTISRYEIRSHQPTLRDDQMVYFYDCVG